MKTLGEIAYTKWKPMIDYKKEENAATFNSQVGQQMLALLLEKAENFFINYKKYSTEIACSYFMLIKSGKLSSCGLNRLIALNYFDKEAPIVDFDYCDDYCVASYGKDTK
jgi:hypothetical protein